MIRFLFVFMLTLFSVNAVAAEVKDVYQGVVEDKGQGQSVLQQAAMSQVLVKVSGSKQLLTDASIKKALNKVDDYLVQFGYQQINGAKHLVVVFDDSKIQQLLRQTGFAVWGKLRPRTVIWVVKDQGGQREILSDLSTDAAKPSIISAAQIRGIPVSLPLMDLDDSMIVSVPDVWGRFVDPVAIASKRYQYDSIVMARLISQGNNWQLQWQLNGQGKNQPQGALENLTQGTERGDPTAAVTVMINKIADYYGKRYAVKSQSESGEFIELYVGNVQDVNSLVTIKRYLNKLSAVASVETLGMVQNQVRFRLNLIGNSAEVIDAIGLESRLQQDVIQDAGYYYNWQAN